MRIKLQTKQIRGVVNSVIGALTALIFSTPASAQLAQAPLEISTFVEPNVMLLLDDSGSMRSTIWDDGYDPTVTYPGWDDGGDNWNPAGVFSDLDNYRSFDDYAACAAYGGGNSQSRNQGDASTWVRGSDPVTPGVTSCIRLPSPLGDDTRYFPNYVNYLFETYVDSNDLDNGVAPDIPGETRMFVALDAAQDLVAVPNNRFCVSRFDDSGQGSVIVANCGTDVATLQTLLDPVNPVIVAAGQTPLAESVYEVVDYFRGTSNSFYRGANYPTDPAPLGSDTTLGNPIQYRCQANFLIAITDGFPVNDFQEFINNPSSTVHPTDSRSSHGLRDACGLDNCSRQSGGFFTARLGWYQPNIPRLTYSSDIGQRVPRQFDPFFRWIRVWQRKFYRGQHVILR